jgi:hypothetical protein
LATLIITLFPFSSESEQARVSTATAEKLIASSFFPKDVQHLVSECCFSSFQLFSLSAAAAFFKWAAAFVAR